MNIQALVKIAALSPAEKAYLQGQLEAHDQYGKELKDTAGSQSGWGKAIGVGGGATGAGMTLKGLLDMRRGKLDAQGRLPLDTDSWINERKGNAARGSRIRERFANAFGRKAKPAPNYGASYIHYGPGRGSLIYPSPNTPTSWEMFTPKGLPGGNPDLVTPPKMEIVPVSGKVVPVSKTMPRGVPVSSESELIGKLRSDVSKRIKGKKLAIKGGLLGLGSLGVGAVLQHLADKNYAMAKKHMDSSSEIKGKIGVK